MSDNYPNLEMPHEHAHVPNVTTDSGPNSLAAAAGSAMYNLTDHPQTPDQLRTKAEALWKLLDDISTAFDMHKPEMQGFERHVWHKCEQRSKQFQSDGYKLYATE